MCLLSDTDTVNSICKTSKSDNRSLNTKSSSNLILYANYGSTKYYLAQITAQYSGKQLIIKDIKNNEFFSDIILETGNVTLYDSNAIAFLLSNSQLRCEDDLFAFAQVFQWMNYAQNHISPAVSGWLLPSSETSVSKNMKANAKISKEDTLCSLTNLDTILHARTYLVGEGITLADISVFTALLSLYEHVFDSHYRKQYINLNRWFLTILNQPQVKSIIKDFTFCTGTVHY